MLLRPAAAIAVAWIVYERVQRRPGSGRKRGLPPGSLEFFPAAPWQAPEYFSKSAARWGPVFQFRHLSRPAVAIVGLDRIGEFLQSHSPDLSSPPAPFNAIVPGGFVRYMRGDEHLDTAVMLRSAMNRAVVEECAGSVRAEARIAIGEIASDPGGCPGAVDRMMLHVMMRCFLGLHRGELRDRFIALYRTADYRRLASTGKLKARRAMNEIISEMRTLAAQERCERSFLSELAKAQPQAIRSDEMMGNFAYALHTARVDVSGLMTWMVAVLGENPQWVSALRVESASNPAAGEVGGLSDRIVRETLRLRQSEFIIRRTRKLIEWNGYTIPAGWHVRLCVAESHRSPEAFDAPETFDPDRFVRTPTRSRYAPFGFAPHLCPGDHLTRWIGRILAVELARGHDIRASDVTPWDFSGFHWRPGSRMKIFLSQATA